MSTNDSLPVILVSAGSENAAEDFITELVGGEAEEGSPRVWLLRNKYYTARVRLQPGGAAPHAHAHVVLLGAADGPRELGEHADAAPDAAVRLALNAAPLAPPLAEAARRLGYELVPLQPPADHEDDGPYGLARAREALHAHPWPGLRREPAAGEGGEGGEGGRGFSAALRLVEAACSLPAEERRARADELLEAFCRALDLDAAEL